MGIQYTEDFIGRLHLVWGPGFLSPGRPEEVGEIMRGLDIAGKRVLDIGCGTGGPAIVLARDKGAQMVCLDVEPQLVALAERNAWYASVSAREVATIEGPLRERIIEVSSLIVYERWSAARQALAQATAGGALRRAGPRGRHPAG